MSRALEKDVVAFLKTGDHSKVYLDISTALTHWEGDGLLEIEFLGRSHSTGPESFLRDGNALAIPKLRLVQAFLVARQVLQTHLADASAQQDDEILAATAVLLLMDPEHLTAANTRKRILQKVVWKGDGVNPYWKDEKLFLDSLLTSRLHRHTKSPTLWSHRRWLMEQHQRHNVLVNVVEDMKTVVMVAGERHPRNYYAWNHARWLVTSFKGDLEGGQQSLVFDEVKSWSYRHHVDVSGWSFLYFLVQMGKSRGEAAPPVFEETLKLAETLQWTNESVWWFLRTMAANGQLTSEAAEGFTAVNDQLLASTPDGSPDQKVLSNARLWHDRYQQFQHRKSRP